MHMPERFSSWKCLLHHRALLDARFSHSGLWTYFCQRLPTLQCSLSAIAYLLVWPDGWIETVGLDSDR